jgi:hypothetical protein
MRMQGYQVMELALEEEIFQAHKMMENSTLDLII